MTKREPAVGPAPAASGHGVLAAMLSVLSPLTGKLPAGSNLWTVSG